jgi:electron transport complex protein RnfB
MPKDVYERVTEALLLRGGAIPPKKCKEFYDLVEELFTEEQADLASRMPLGAVSAEKMAELTGRDLGEVERLLEGMADQGLVFCREKGGVRLYTLHQLVPGISEYQFMRGTYTEHDKRLAHLFERLHEVTWGTPEADKGRPTFPFSRVLVVEKVIPTGVEIHLYDKVSEYIKKAEYISVAQCFCRHQAELLGRPCDKPKETCFCFGPSARFVAERGFGRFVTKEEALQILDRCEEAGLVHCSSNVAESIDFVCNCCTCHCGILQTFKDPNRVKFGARSNYIVETDSERCVGCESCVQICPVEALRMEDDMVRRDPSLCIGCGLCVSACPSEALKMVPREEKTIPPRNFHELMAALNASIKQ